MNQYFQNEQAEMGYSDAEMLLALVKEDASGDDMDWVLGDLWFDDYYEVRDVFVKEVYARLSDSDKVELERLSRREFGFEMGFAAYFEV